MRTIRSIAFLAAAFVCSACSQARLGVQSPSPKEVLDHTPGWFRSDESDSNYLLAKATATSSDYQLAMDIAQSEARAAMAMQIEVKVEAETRRFMEQVAAPDTQRVVIHFASISKDISSHVLSGAAVRRHEELPEARLFRSYVLMQLPTGEVARELLERIRATEILSVELRATDAYRQLEEDVKKYEDERRARELPRDK